ncbi:MAG: hypothetical protein WC872_03455 [Candidatus Absconditabacterales bacterium]
MRKAGDFLLDFDEKLGIQPLTNSYQTLSYHGMSQIPTKNVVKITSH